MLGPHVHKVNGSWFATTDPFWPDPDPKTGEKGRKLAGPCDSPEEVFEALKNESEAS